MTDALILTSNSDQAVSGNSFKLRTRVMEFKIHMRELHSYLFCRAVFIGHLLFSPNSLGNNRQFISRSLLGKSLLKCMGEGRGHYIRHIKLLKLPEEPKPLQLPPHATPRGAAVQGRRMVK